MSNWFSRFMRLFRFFPLFQALLVNFSVQAATYEVAHDNPRAADEGPGSVEQPWKTISKAAGKVVAGDTVIIHGGVYREDIVIKASGTEQDPIRFQSATGERVVVSGTERLHDWKRAGVEKSVYRVDWPHKFNTWSKTMTHPGDEYHRVVGRGEQVLVEDYFQRQALNMSELGPGAFYVDTTNGTLYVWDIGNRDLNHVRVEASVRSRLLALEGSHIQIRGIQFQYAANAAQHGAVDVRGSHNLLEDCVVERMNASGASFVGPNHVARRCVFRENGQLGFGAGGAHYFLMTGCRVENNNIKGFDRGWESGGDKLCFCREAVLENSSFVHNRGTGIWFDIGNTNCTVRNCFIADNEDAGIFYEISFELHATDNVIIGNGFADSAGAWGAQAGIVLSSSPYCVIERNLLIGNREGFNFREQNRTTPTVDDPHERPVWNHDQTIRHNIVACNRDAQIWGWFDIKDNHWPARMQSVPQPSAQAPKPGDIAGDYTAKTDAVPKGLSLERLNIRFEANIYFMAPGQGGFNWGVSWSKHTNYATLPEFQSELAIDKGSQVFDPHFAAILQHDLRLPAEIMARAAESYPRGSVPGVSLGVIK